MHAVISDRTVPDSETSTKTTSSLWRLVSGGSIVAFNSNGHTPPIYCVHSIAGDVGVFEKLSHSLGADHPLYGIQVAKRKMAPEFASSIGDIARDHVQALLAFQPEGQIVLGGWSTGAVIALEMAQQLSALGREVPLLLAFDGAPTNNGVTIRRSNPRYIWNLLRNAPGWLMDDQGPRWSWQVFSARIRTKINFHLKLHRLSSNDDATMHDEAVQGVLNREGWSNSQAAFIRALWEAQRAYVPKPYTGPVVLYEAKIKPLFQLLQLAQAWRIIVPNVEIVRLPSGHSTIFSEPAITVMTDHLRGRLADIRSSSERET
jgi:thioesterase domain-containing protein